MMKDISASIIRPAGGATENTRPAGPRAEQDAALFKGALDNASSDKKVAFAGPSGSGEPFLQPSAALKFSNHAVDRMQARGVRFSPEEMKKIESAAAKAEAKGAKNCLLISDQAALIVSLKDKTVVTVMDKANLKENVFTNIDSTVMV